MWQLGTGLRPRHVCDNFPGVRHMTFRLKKWLGIGSLLLVVVLGLVAVEFSAGPGASQVPEHQQRQSSDTGMARPALPGALVTALPPPPAALASLATLQRAAQAPGHSTPGHGIDAQPAEAEGEVCGIGQAPPRSPEATTLAKEADARSGEAAARLFALMANSADPAVRAAGQLGTDQREALAMSARRSSNATVYAFAMQACSRMGVRPAACAQLSSHRMAELDPLNVVPWLWVAEEASTSGNEQGVVEAVYRASLATESRLREFAFADLALSAIPADWPTRDAVLASAKVLRIHADLLLPSYLAMVKQCSAENARDFNVRQTCDRLARVLVEHGDTIVDHGIGRRIGERAGWPAETVELLEARHAAYKRFALDGDALAAGSTHGACGRLLRSVQVALSHARHGEMLYARTRLAEMGVTDAEALLEFRKLRQAASSPN